MSIFGFAPRSSGGGADFLPIVKYDARSGLIFRMDAVQTAQGWDRTPVNITAEFKALFDMENMEVGWIDFATGGAPSFVMVRYPGAQYPARPNPAHKAGARIQIKLAKGCADGQPAIREMAGNSDRFRDGIEALYASYADQKMAHPGLLPVVVMQGATPVTTGGKMTSTNFQPNFVIVDWAPRGDFPAKVFEAPAPQQAVNGHAQAGPPATGSQHAAPPQAKAKPVVAADDFG